MGKRIDRVDARARLEPRREPYWMRLAEGRYVGVRRLTASSAGSWMGRYYDGERYQSKPLGDFSDRPEKDRFDAARRAAEDWFRHLDRGGSTKTTTVKAACEAYVAKLRTEKSEAAADDAEGRFKRLVYDAPIGRVDLAKLAPRHVADWKAKALKSGSRSSYNRNATALRAALNLAHDRRDVASDHAWRAELKPLEGASGRRELYLDAKARAKLVAEASDEARPLFRALALLPLRVGELARLRVGDLDTRHRVLHVRAGKTGSREVPLGGEAFGQLKACAEGQHPSAWLVRRANGDQWDRFAWRDEMKLAAAAAKLPRATCAYTLRHSLITDMVAGGTDLFTIAKLSGTSVAMIERHYGHLQREHARAALDRLALGQAVTA